MVEIPQTQKKLRETQFFFQHLHDKEMEHSLEHSEEFDFFLSAFVSSGRSVTFALQAEQKEAYDRWFPGWKNSLTEKDQDLLSFMNNQRVAEVKKKGAKVHTEIELVPLTEVRTRGESHPAYGIHWFAPPGTPPLEIGKRVNYFEVGATKQEVVTTCKRYLELLEKLVKDFSAFITHTGPETVS